MLNTRITLQDHASPKLARPSVMRINSYPQFRPSAGSTHVISFISIKPEYLYSYKRDFISKNAI